MAEFTLPQGYLEPEKDHNIAALRAELAQVRVENARLEQWNNAVAVCEKHTGRIIASGCYVCVADEFEGENTALRARIAKLEAEVERVKKEWFRVAEQYNRETSRLNAVRVRLREAATRIQQIVDTQALDEGLWFEAETAAEAYLQQELRKLHAVVEAAALEGKG